MTQVNTQSGSGGVTMPFTDADLTASVNILPTQFGGIGAEGFFPTNDPLATPYFEIDIVNDVISALPVTDGGPATIARHGSQEARIFRVPQIAHQDDVLARDILGWNAIAARTRKPETLENLVNQRLMKFRRKFDITLEVMRISALKGKIVDGKGQTILDLYGAFELTKKQVFFDLSNAASDIQAKCDLVIQLIQQDLADEVMTNVEVRCSSQFFTKLIQHAKVQQYWLQAEQALALANIVRNKDGGYRPREFTFGNIHFVEYPIVVPFWGGTATRLVAQGMGHAYPAGTLDTHTTYVSPPEDIRVIDGQPTDVGDLLHITTEPMKHGKGVEMLGQMNALPIWRRPKLLVELSDASGSDTALAA